MLRRFNSRVPLTPPANSLSLKFSLVPLGATLTDIVHFTDPWGRRGLTAATMQSTKPEPLAA